MRPIITKKQIGIFMDHAKAIFIHPENADTIDQDGKSIVTPHEIENETVNNTRSNHASNNSFIEHKEQNNLKHFYNEIVDAIAPFDEILLMGPSNANEEFYNHCKKIKKLSDKKMILQKSDYLSKNEIINKVNNYFNNTINV